MKNEEIEVFETAIIRTSLFSWEDLPQFEDWLKTGKSPFSEEQTQAIKEAIYLASPNLYNEMLKWESGKMTDSKEVEKLQASLYKYFSRMSTRCTPFGLFAGCGTLQVGDKNQIELGNRNEFKRNTRLDMFYLCELAERLVLKPFIQPYLNYYPSTAIYAKAKELRYVEYSFRSGKRIHQIAEVEKDEYLQLILSNAKHGASIPALSNLLVDDEITLEEAEEFINELIGAQLLVSELDPSVTGDDNLDIMIDKLSGIQQSASAEHGEEIQKVVAQLVLVKDLLNEIDQKVGNSIELYAKLEEVLHYFEIKFDKSKLIQVDLFQEFNNGQLDQSILDDVKEGIQFMHRLTQPRERESFKNFKKEVLR